VIGIATSLVQSTDIQNVIYRVAVENSRVAIVRNLQRSHVKFPVGPVRLKMCQFNFDRDQQLSQNRKVVKIEKLA
jgi:hypothetical protein